jgi:hypothetical protein
MERMVEDHAMKNADGDEGRRRILAMKEGPFAADVRPAPSAKESPD